MIEGLLRWYEVHCDGEWEHRHGVTIQTADNPGVILRVDIAADAVLDPGTDRLIHEQDSGGPSWIELRVADRQLVGFAAPSRVPEMFRRAIRFLGPSYS